MRWHLTILDWQVLSAPITLYPRREKTTLKKAKNPCFQQVMNCGPSGHHPSSFTTWATTTAIYFALLDFKFFFFFFLHRHEITVSIKFFFSAASNKKEKRKSLLRKSCWWWWSDLLLLFIISVESYFSSRSVKRERQLSKKNSPTDRFCNLVDSGGQWAFRPNLIVIVILHWT